jgi:thiamine-phosphate pyrophosphorylase
MTGDDLARGRRARLHAARLYLIGDAADLRRVLAPALAGGVDIVQLRDKDLDDDALTAAAQALLPACRAAGALFIVNDRPAVAARAGADGVHVGQDDAPVAQARELVGAERLVGLSTHTPQQVDAAAAVDYIGVGPVHATPTKPGRPAVGLDLVHHAARHASVPFFAIGGIEPDNVEAVVRAGARRVAVVRAILRSTDPRAAAERLRAAVEASEVELAAR